MCGNISNSGGGVNMFYIYVEVSVLSVNDVVMVFNVDLIVFDFFVVLFVELDFFSVLSNGGGVVDDWFVGVVSVGLGMVLDWDLGLWIELGVEV